ncbi:MAG: hypothetical protein ABIP06_03825 [Pyrinomonadaceae bacterium]
MKKISLVVGVLLLLLTLQNNVLACACCAEPGTYSIWTGKTEGYYLDVVDGIEFDQKAYLYMTEAGFAMIKGLSEIEKDYNDKSWIASSGIFDLNGSYAAKSWKLNFKTKSGKTGTLNLPMPAQMLTFKVDIHDGKNIGGGGPLLYKEFRFKGNVGTGSGFFQKGIVKPTSYFLVLKGRGNGCDNSEDFTHWYLEIRGKNAKYEFFGKLSSANPDYIFDEKTEEETEN